MELGARRERTQPPPPAVLWETLVEPRRPGGRQWLVLVEDEVEPKVLRAERPSLVVWSSLWSARRNDQIRFVITDDGGGGSSLKWGLETDDAPPSPAVLGRMRYRINFLINGEMRYSFG